MINKEEWCPIRGLEGLYEVSNFGRVRSLNYRHTGQTKVLSPIEDKDGYLFVNLYKNGTHKMFKIHRLVAQTFIPNWFNDLEVNHIDEKKYNNHVDNLEWCDRKYNINFGTCIERMVEKNTNGKLSKPVLQMTKTGEIIREWPSTMEAGRNGFDQGSVASCCRGELKSHGGYIWKYK